MHGCTPPRGRRRPLAARERPPGEDGFSIVEVMASALLVVIASIAVFTGLDGASATSGSNKARSVAADLAQQDQERLRGEKVSKLSNLRESRTVAVTGVNYTVASRADWVSDKAGTTSCTGDARADYLQITSTVTWPNMVRVRPVTIRSIVAPPTGSFGDNQGSLAVQVNDRDGTGLGGIPVSVAGPANLSETTNSAGCAFFGYLPEGSGYRIRFSREGFVTRQGVNAVDLPTSVIAEAVNTVPIDYDQAASISATFKTIYPSAPGALVDDDAHWLSIENSGLTAGIRVFGNGTPATRIEAPSLFPFREGYTVWSGNCQGSKPPWAPVVALNPGETAQVAVREPNLNVQVRRSGSPLQMANVKLTPRSTGCTQVLSFKTCMDSSLPSCAPNTAGRLERPGVPYGTYDVCADDAVRRVIQTAKANQTETGNTLWNLDVPTSGASRVC